MVQNRHSFWIVSTLFLVVPVLSVAQATRQNRTFVLAGHPGEIPISEQSGHAYVEIEALTRLVNGSLSFSGHQIVLTLPPSNENTSTTHPAAGLTKEFLRAAIEQMSVIREWRSTLIGAVQRGFPVTEDWMRTFSDRAQHDLRLVSVAASTQSDMNALQLLNSEFNNMKMLSDRFVEANKSRTYTPTDALDKDPLNGKILNCGRSLAAMAASGQFVDDGSCQ
jgi:hypothetical protein